MKDIGLFTSTEPEESRDRHGAANHESPTKYVTFDQIEGKSSHVHKVIESFGSSSMLLFQVSVPPALAIKGSWPSSCIVLQSTSFRQHLLQVLLLRLQVRVAANMFVVDEDVGDGGLAGDFGKGALDDGAVICAGMHQYLFEGDLASMEDCLPIWSNSSNSYLAPISLRSVLVALQYGHHDLLKTAARHDGSAC